MQQLSLTMPSLPAMHFFPSSCHAPHLLPTCSTTLLPTTTILLLTCLPCSLPPCHPPHKQTCRHFVCKQQLLLRHHHLLPLPSCCLPTTIFVALHGSQHYLLPPHLCNCLYTSVLPTLPNNNMGSGTDRQGLSACATAFAFGRTGLGLVSVRVLYASACLSLATCTASSPPPVHCHHAATRSPNLLLLPYSPSLTFSLYARASSCFPFYLLWFSVLSLSDPHLTTHLSLHLHTNFLTSQHV